MNLVGAIAHELTHCMQGKHHGYFSLSRSMMPWQREGYAEYIAHRNARLREDYSLTDSLNRLLSPEKIKPVNGWMTAEDGFDYPVAYYRARVMTEYLFDVEGVSYAGYIEANFHKVYERMNVWHKRNAEQGE